MGRPREHGPAMRARLLDAADALIAAGGPDALSVRTLADEVGTTTRAVYSVFGSKEGLLAALAQRAFEVLGDSIARLPVTDDPAADLVEASVRVFRSMAIDLPAAYRLMFLRIVPDLEIGSATIEASRRSMALLRERFERLEAAGGLGGRSVTDATFEFHAMCEGLATIELRNPASLGDDPERTWRRAISTLLGGFEIAPPAG